MENVSEIQICIDNRERDLHKQIQYYLDSIEQFSNSNNNTDSSNKPSEKKIHITITSKPLPLGDVIIKSITKSASEETENAVIETDEVVVERKSISDLLSSIKDGRYEEQSYRLNGSSTHNHNIIYLVEGSILTKAQSQPQQTSYYNNKYTSKTNKENDKFTAYSAIFSLNYYKGFSVIRTVSLEESALFICNCANKLRKGIMDKKKSYYTNYKIETNSDNLQNDETSISPTPTPHYSQVVKKIKKENITPSNIGEIMLCQIPGISSTTAVVIMNKFHTMDNLIKNIKEHGVTCLKEITYTNNDKTRKISKSSIDNIIKFLGN